MKTLDDYKGTLPYASELFGIYQPLLGWKSQITQRRYDRIRSGLYAQVAARALVGTRPAVRVHVPETRAAGLATTTGALTISHLTPVDFQIAAAPHVSTTIDSGVARLILADIGSQPPKDWTKVISPTAVQAQLDKLRTLVGKPDELQKNADLASYIADFSKAYGQSETQVLLQQLFAKECTIAGYLLFLAQHTPAMLTPLFFQSPRAALMSTTQLADPLLNFGSNQYDAVLSPIGVMHMYRQYFFELDSFLGPPVGHVWLSPGGTVELFEISTRKVVTEKSLEQSLETTTKSETSTTTEDDIADAVKEENRDNIKFGFSNTASYSAAVVSDSATADLSIEHGTTTSREATHKQMRQQSEKLSSEIKRNFKTTFKTSTEETNTSSKRYVLQNTSDKLVNYELRRKMRKVGVQVQDIGVSLCWHAYVDDAGRNLGIAKLVHMGKPPELSDLVQPDAPQMPLPQAQEVNIAIPFVGIDTDDTDNAYTDGTETEVGLFDSTEHIQPDFDQRVTFASPGYTLTAVDLDPQGSDAKLSVRNLQSAAGSSTGAFTVHLDYVNWNKQNQIPVKVTLRWEPGDAVRQAITDQYNARMADYNQEKARRFQEAFYAAARERIKLASEITPRPAEDLREEERTVVYRALVDQLMSVGTHLSKHVVSELVRSMFDVDRMLYFVAPEWWAPRLHRSAQDLGDDPSTTSQPTPPVLTSPATTVKPMHLYSNLVNRIGGVASSFGTPGRGTAITSEDIVDWGGAKELDRDSYYITEDSAPAKLGASLGWLLQLDGDNLRNAFLNSPWVKAVIPIRIGKERAALNWLQQAHVEGSDGLDAAYIATDDDPPELHSTPGHTVTIRDAIDRLIDGIQTFDRTSRTPIVGDPANPDDPSNHFAGSLPTEAVFEHGFYPLQGGVRFDGNATEQTIFSQWIEILPTDQVAALAVEYDPKTLQVKDDTPT